MPFYGQFCPVFTLSYIQNRAHKVSIGLIYLFWGSYESQMQDPTMSVVRNTSAIYRRSVPTLFSRSARVGQHTRARSHHRCKNQHPCIANRVFKWRYN